MIKASEAESIALVAIEQHGRVLQALDELDSVVKRAASNGQRSVAYYELQTILSNEESDLLRDHLMGMGYKTGDMGGTFGARKRMVYLSW